MDEADLLAQRFEENRANLRAVAQRMLGSAAEADDAVQEAWLRLDRAGAGRGGHAPAGAAWTAGVAGCPPWRAGCVWPCCARAGRGARSRWTPGRPSRSA